MTRRIVLWQIVGAFLLWAPVARTQRTAAVRVDSIHTATFQPTSMPAFTRPHADRTIDVVLSGGAGFFAQGTTAPFQATANADFFARTASLDFAVGAHYGFSDPATTSLSLGLRWPITERDDDHGVYGDATLLFIDNGQAVNSSDIGLRAALAARSGFVEYRAVAELRNVPFTGASLKAWGGLELGIALHLLREDYHGQTRKELLHSELKYIATSKELEDLDGAASDADLDTWLDRFWQARNVTGTPRNEARIEYMRRIDTVNARFGGLRHWGVSTDMGRVYLLYGEPSRIEDAFSTATSDRKFQLWAYDNRVLGHSRALFLFLRVEGGQFATTYIGPGGYREIYSNIPGEYSDGIPSDLPVAMRSYIDSFGR